MRLQGKTAIITGAAAGIGRAAAQLFVREGARVLLVDRSEQELREVAASLDEAAIFRVADVTDEAAMRGVVDTALSQFGAIDVFVANAGIEGVIKPIVDYPLDNFERVINVNVRAVLLGLQAVLPHMIARRQGSVIVTASHGALHAAPGMVAYIASKHAVVGLMKTAALEVAEYGVRVNTVNPGPVETRMMRSIEEGNRPGHAEDAYHAAAARSPMRRYAEPEEVAQTMLFLASDDSRHCSGSMYAVDGGLSAR